MTNSVTRRIHFDRHPGQFVVLPEGSFRLANPDAIRLGHTHLIQYAPFDRFVQIVAADASPPLVLPTVAQWLKDHPTDDQPVS